jgi:hypothetical protein
MLTVEKIVEFSKEVEVSISAEDIRQCFITSPLNESLPAAMELIADCGRVLNGLPDSIIDEMHPEARKTVHTFLQKAADRFDTKELICQKLKSNGHPIA